ncbi:lipid A deacylase LpxR family protein [Oleiharenicola lentus]|uniref:Lipid A deacylase LpxR family protein n=1 Tax=Oleiharenicola lentus TaxID=2508720 RepID=A0A4Q1C5X6_9BACT|nr:lipid A deacylase LpxR family protein [Oleiharenicola lentus]RXK53862.1 lipid A deacylase LpxR family protein [Oleiharenicola lentus]
MRFPRVIASLLLSAATVVVAEEAAPVLNIRSSTFTVVTENDKYFAGTDRHYTNGLKLTWLGETNLNESYPFVQTAAKVIPWMDPAHVNWRYKVGFALGQNIYTPTDTDTTALIPDDRPYAGWLYGSIILQAQLENQLRLVELSLGVVGPSALGEQFQNRFHDLINVARANGWANQLRDEPGLRLTWERRYRTWQWQGSSLPELGVDLVLRHRITLGNVYTHAAGGAVVRLGWRLPADFGPDLIRPGGGNTPISGGPKRFGAYVYASSEVRAVARDIFLDGNTWRDSHSVDKRPFVADLSLGLVFQWPSFRFAYTQDYRTKEFYGQPRRDVFGSIGFSFSR